jgi:hypothetical protein
MLSGTKKAEYFSNDPQKEFTKIDANIELVPAQNQKYFEI